MSLFDTYIAVDWSGGNDRGASPKQDAIWIGVAGEEPLYMRNRQVAESWLVTRLEQERERGRKVAIGFDFAFGFPWGFARHLTGSENALAVWDWFEARFVDGKASNNRFDLCAEINASLPGIGPFWFNGLKRDIVHLPRKGGIRTNTDFAEKRRVETLAKGAFSVWQLGGAGAVGSQVITGLPLLARLRRMFAEDCAAWPFETEIRPVTLIEVWPSLFHDTIAPRMSPGEIKDKVQVAVTAQIMRQMDLSDRLLVALRAGQVSGAEGWILGVPNPDMVVEKAS